MKIRRFVAKDIRTALAQIKEELGANAVIMSNKKIPEGVELMAAVDHTQPAEPEKNTSATNATSDFSAKPDRNNYALAEDSVRIGSQQKIDAETASAQTSHSSTQDSPADSLQALLSRQVQQPVNTQSVATALTDEAVSIEQQLKSFTDRLQQSAQTPPTAQTVSQKTKKAPAEFDIADDNQQNEFDNIGDSIESFNHRKSPMQTMSIGELSKMQFDMQQEMSSIRQLLEHQVSGLVWQDMVHKEPNKAMLITRLMDMGITDEIADQVATMVPSHLSEEESWNFALNYLAEQLSTLNNDIIQRGGVVSLVGPTGVGKTTTIAKLAARFAQLHGAKEVALISTDTYRIGGFEQLETYGRIIGCQVKLAKDANELNALIEQYSNKKLILIDTAGMGQRDMRLAEHLATFMTTCQVNIRNYLVLAANTQACVMQENVDRFKKIPLSGVIYTKLDESLSIGEIISTSIQNGLSIDYLTVGQRVPEDIKVANAVKLVSLAEKMASRITVKRTLMSRAFNTTSTSVG